MRRDYSKREKRERHVGSEDTSFSNFRTKKNKVQ